MTFSSKASAIQPFRLSWFAQQRDSMIWMTKQDDDKEKKVPKGFEKFFKKKDEVE